MPTYSIIAHDGNSYGPVGEQALGEWIQQGRVNAQTVLHIHETNARVTAGMVPALHQALGLSAGQVNQLLHPPAGAYHPQTGHPQPQQGYVQPHGGYAPSPAGMPMAYATPGGMSMGGPPQHGLTQFSTVGAVFLCMFVPLFALIFYGSVHGKMPKRRADDPGMGKAIGFMFIPIFSIYWMCFFWVRLCTRINDERIRVGLPPTAPRSLVVAMLWCFLGLLIPFLNLLVAPAVCVMMLIALIQIQGSINSLASATWRGR